MKTDIKQLKTYIVGGAVRDYVLGKTPHDFDYVVVGSTHEEMISIGFEKVGANFPVYLHPTTGDEYALARREKKTGSGYLGFSCEFGPDVTLEEDLGRRDFTCNSMALDIETFEVTDPYNGRQDIKDKIIRATSNAFAEDPLRVLRLARFAAKYKFTIEPKTMRTACEIVSNGGLNELPAERFWAEIQKVVDNKTVPDFFTKLFFMNVYSHSTFFMDALPRGKTLSDAIVFDPKSLDLLSVKLADSRTTIYPTAKAERLRKVVDAFKEYKMLKSVHSMMMLLKLANAFREGSLIDDLVDYASMNKFASHNEKEMRDVMVSVRLCKTVRAADFPMLSGKQLGAAMELKQLELINCVLGH